jgi:hypothetical protein
MKLYDTDKEEKFIEKSFLTSKWKFLDTTDKSYERFWFLYAFGSDDDKTEVVVTDDPYEQQPQSTLLILNITSVIRAIRFCPTTKTQRGWSVEDYIEIVNTKDLNQILFDLPPESNLPSVVYTNYHW